MGEGVHLRVYPFFADTPLIAQPAGCARQLRKGGACRAETLAEGGGTDRTQKSARRPNTCWHWGGYPL